MVALQHELAEVGLDLRAVMQRFADLTRALTAGTSAAVRLLDGDALVCGAISGAPDIAQPPPAPAPHQLLRPRDQPSRAMADLAAWLRRRGQDLQQAGVRLGRPAGASRLRGAPSSAS